MTAWLADQPLLTVLTVHEIWRRARRLLHGVPLERLLPLTLAPGRFRPVPPGLRRGDRALAEAIYSGRFRGEQRLVAAGGRSIFEMAAPSQAFRAELNGFEWLRHLDEAGDALAGENARALLNDWMRSNGRASGGTGYQPEVTARRVVAWLIHGNFLLAGASDGFKRRFVRSLCAQARQLNAIASDAPDGLPRLTVRIALAFCSLCLNGETGRVQKAAHGLSRELQRQILPDGGHISRDPSVLVPLVDDLLALRETYREAGQALPKGLYPAIDRILPALRFFRHGDGHLALFNGAGASDGRRLEALVACDETQGEPFAHARQSGYHRLAAGDTLLIADTGLPPAVAVAGRAHAGTLSFEMSCGLDRLVVNCGRPSQDHDDWRRLSRSTAAHSTVTIGDCSSSRFARSAGLDRFLGTPLVPGPTEVPSADPTGEGLGFDAGHDGYGRGFGLIHRRAVVLSRTGDCVEGRDGFEAVSQGRIGPCGGPVERRRASTSILPWWSSGRGRRSG